MNKIGEIKVNSNYHSYYRRLNHRVML